jgi:hypothetical protein
VWGVFPFFLPPVEFMGVVLYSSFALAIDFWLICTKKIKKINSLGPSGVKNEPGNCKGRELKVCMPMSATFNSYLINYGQNADLWTFWKSWGYGLPAKGIGCKPIPWSGK